MGAQFSVCRPWEYARRTGSAKIDARMIALAITALAPVRVNANCLAGAARRTDDLFIFFALGADRGLRELALAP